MNASTDQMTPEKADWMARCFVNGARRHSKSGNLEPLGGEFADRFLGHPWVRASVLEGWGKELRGHLIRTVRIRLMRGESYDNINDLMPPKDWVNVARDQAARFKQSDDWQKKHMPNGLQPKGSLRAMPRGDDE